MRGEEAMANRRLRGALVLAVGLFLAPQARAGWILDHWHHDCPPSSYSPCHYWTPAAYRVYAACHGPKLGIYAPDRFPGIPPRVVLTTYPCPAAPPSEFPYGAPAPAQPPAP
jgi:hypothetical protein